MVCSGDGFRCSFPPTALMRPALYFWESHNRNCNSIKSSRTRQTNAHTHTSAEKIFPYVKLNSIYYIPCCGKQYGYPNYNMQGNCIFFGWLLFAISMSMPSRRTCTKSPCDVWNVVLCLQRNDCNQPNRLEGEPKMNMIHYTIIRHITLRVCESCFSLFGGNVQRTFIVHFRAIESFNGRRCCQSGEAHSNHLIQENNLWLK